MVLKLVLAFVLVRACVPCLAGEHADPARPQAPWPPADGPLRVVIDTDAANEVDDQYALALALGFPDRLQVKGIVAAHFGDGGGPAGIDRSYAEIERVLQKADMKGRIPVKRGVDPFDPRKPIPMSDGLEMIVEQALAATPEEPLWLVALGPPTDAVAALLKEPRIADRMIVFWHGRSEWPTWCRNFNARNDPVATRLVFDTPSRFVLFDTGAHLTLPLEESQRRIAPAGPLGAYLHEIRGRNPNWLSDKKGMFDLADIAALIDPTCARWERTAAPAVTDDLSYDFSKSRGQIVRIYDVDRDAAFNLLDESLRRLQHGNRR